MTKELLNQSNEEIRYLSFLHGTLQAEKLNKEICDEFTRKIFGYLEGELLFDSQVFCAFVYKFIYKCRLNMPSVNKAKNSHIEELNLKRHFDELFFFLDGNQIRFALPSFEVNTFLIPLEEKLQNLLITDAASSNSPIVKIILPEIKGNADFITTVDLEFTLPSLTTEQKLDVLHFTICAFNFLSQKDEQFKVIPAKLVSIRELIIKNVIRQKEDSEDGLEFSEHLPDTAGILIAQTQDLEIEKQWLEEKKIKPTDWLNRRQENRKKRDEETAAIEKAMQLEEAKVYIDEIVKWLNEPN